MRLKRVWAYGVGFALAAGGVHPVDLQGGMEGRAEVSADHARVEVSLEARQVSFYRNGKRVATFPIAVGKPDWPTRTGEWRIYQIDLNPDWTPPTDEKWAEDRKYKEPGHPENPMGRIRIIYDPPRSIHGTDATESIGRAASHGSIRIRNQDGFELARMIMAASGDSRSQGWWDRALGDESTMVTVELSNPVPIRVRKD